MFAELCKVVPIGIDEDMSSDVTLDSINMRNFHKATIVLLFGTLGTATSTLAIYSGATDAALTSAVTANYAWGSAATPSASCDVLADWTAASTVAITYSTYSNYMLVVEVDAAAMDVANAEEWLTLKIPRTGSATGSVTAVAILEPRYTDGASATALS